MSRVEAEIVDGRFIFRALRDLLEAVREQGLLEHRCLDQIVQAEIALANESVSLGESFPSLHYLNTPERSSGYEEHPHRPSCP
jgi:hypothetical protein